MPQSVRWLFAADLLMGVLAVAAFAVSEALAIDKIDLLPFKPEGTVRRA